MNQTPGSFSRHYPDGAGDNPYFDHIGGIVRNNTVWNRSGIHLETGIELMNVKDAEVYHNTVVALDAPFNSMEWRWPNTTVSIKNNLVSHALMPRNGAQAQMQTNLENALPALFVDAAGGDLHLAPTAAQAIDKGSALQTGLAVNDMDCQPRDAKPDIGADEYSTSAIPRKNSGMTRPPDKCRRAGATFSMQGKTVSLEWRSHRLEGATGRALGKKAR